MIKYDMITGDPSFDGSPPMSEQEITNNANLIGQGEFFYDPNQRLANIRNQQNQYNSYMNNPAYNYQFNNFMNPPQSGGFYGYAGNPAASYMQAMNQNPYMMRPQPQDYTYHIPGFNTGSNVLLPADAEDICDKLQMEMMIELEEANIARIERQKSYYSNLGFGNNYYGMPYINNFYQDPVIVNKYKQKIEKIRRDAEENRTNLNKNLSRLCHNYLEGEVNEEEIERIYAGRDVTIPAQEVQEIYNTSFFESLVPIDTSQLYQQHNAQVTTEYRKIFEETSDMNTFLRDCGKLIVNDMIEEENHKRRNMSNLYRQDGAYKMLIRQKIKERYNNENGGSVSLPILGQQNNNQIPMGQVFPTLNQSAKLLDDGSLQISAPSWLGDKQFTIKNTMEDDYEIQRGKFIQSVNNSQGGG